MNKNFQFQILNFKCKGGQSLIEFLLAIGLCSILLPALLTGLITSRDGKAQQRQRVEAVSLLHEATEAIRVVRETGWDTFTGFSNNTDYHLVNTGTSWTLALNHETIDGFDRKIVFNDVMRDSNGSISSSGVVDPSTRQVTITVSWSTPIPYSVVSTIYLTRYSGNSLFQHTTVAQFSQPGNTLNNTTITNSGGGEVTLSAAGPGRGNWCIPKIVSQVDLPRQGEARSLTAIPFEVFAGTGINASGVAFADVAFNNPAYPTPPVGTIVGTVNSYKTNDVFGETGYAYLATDTNSKEIVIISTANYAEVGNYNIPGSANASAIFVLNNVGYTAEGNTLYTFDLSSKTGARPGLDSLNITGTITSIYVVKDTSNNTYAFVTTNDTARQIQIINATDPSDLRLISTYSPPALRFPTPTPQTAVGGGKNIYVSPDGERAYLVTASSATQPEFFIINTHDKSNPVLVSSTSYYDTQGMNPSAVNMVLSGYRALIVGTGGAEQYQVVDITNETAPTHCGGLSIPTNAYDASAVLEPDKDAYAYVVTGDSSNELKIIEGGPGGQYASSGTYESPPFSDIGKNISFNNFSAVITKPVGTDVQFQLGIGDAGPSGCNDATYNFIGPSVANPLAPDPNTKFRTAQTSESQFIVSWPVPVSTGPGYKNPGRCAKYRIYYSTSDPLKTPTVYETNLQYVL